MRQSRKSTPKMTRDRRDSSRTHAAKARSASIRRARKAKYVMQGR